MKNLKNNPKLYYIHLKEGHNIKWALFKNNELISQGNELEDGFVSKEEINEMANKKEIAIIHIKDERRINPHQKYALMQQSREWREYFSSDY